MVLARRAPRAARSSLMGQTTREVSLFRMRRGMATRERTSTLWGTVTSDNDAGMLTLTVLTVSLDRPVPDRVIFVEHPPATFTQLMTDVSGRASIEVPQGSSVNVSTEDNVRLQTPLSLGLFVLLRIALPSEDAKQSAIEQVANKIAALNAPKPLVRVSFDDTGVLCLETAGWRTADGRSAKEHNIRDAVWLIRRY